MSAQQQPHNNNNTTHHNNHTRKTYWHKSAMLDFLFGPEPSYDG
jgi:hypothetical protein